MQSDQQSTLDRGMKQHFTITVKYVLLCAVSVLLMTWLFGRPLANFGNFIAASVISLLTYRIVTSAIPKFEQKLIFPAIILMFILMYVFSSYGPRRPGLIIERAGYTTWMYVRVRDSNTNKELLLPARISHDSGRYKIHSLMLDTDKRIFDHDFYLNYINLKSFKTIRTKTGKFYTIKLTYLPSHDWNTSPY